MYKTLANIFQIIHYMIIEEMSYQITKRLSIEYNLKLFSNRKLQVQL